MYRILELAPVVVPLIGATMLYTYRLRLRGVLGVASLAVVLGLAAGGLGFVGDNLPLFAHDSSHHTESLLALLRNITLAAAWLCLLAAALKQRNHGSTR